MPLRLDDLVAYRSNWSEKSENIRELAETLNLGLDSFIFIDDNPFEIEEVRLRLPSVECHLFDRTRPEQALSLLDGIASLRARNVTVEDLAKTELYRGEAQRQELQRSAASMDEYLASLDIRVHMVRNNPDPPAGHAADQQDKPVQSHNAALHRGRGRHRDARG